MVRRQKLARSAAVGIACLASAVARAQISDPAPDIPVGSVSATVAFVAQLPDSGPLSKPTARPMDLAGDGGGRTFVADQNGIVYQLHAGGSLSVFLDLAAHTSLHADQGQRGLSSFAFHPDYHQVGAPGAGKFFTASSQTSASGTPDYPVPAGAPISHHSVLHEWTVSADPNAIDPSSAREILRVGETYNDHNVGRIGFDPALEPGDPDYGLLYVAFGDGGNVCCPRPSVDPHLVGQSLASPLGSLARIDPLLPPSGGAAYGIPAGNPFALDGDPTTLGEIWAYGLRNPHVFSWDRGGQRKLLISDIGQANLEEINLGAVGANYGWSEREGTFLVVHTNELEVFALPGNDASFGYTYPALQYDHDEDDRAISGGFVFRSAMPSSLEGHYIFGDLASGRVFHAHVAALDGVSPAAFDVLRLVDASDGQEKSLLEMIGGGTPAPRADLRFGIDDDGWIHLVTKRDGVIRRLVPQFDDVTIPSGGIEASLLLLLLMLATSFFLLRRRGH